MSSRRSNRPNLLSTFAILFFALLPASASAQLPSGWAVASVGSPAVLGTASFSNGTFTVSGAGTGVWGPSDQLAFVHRQMTGDGAIVARLETLSAASRDTEVGVMVRESLAANARVVFMRLTGSGWFASVKRSTSGQYATSTAIGGFAAPVWLKLERSGGSVLASYSADGVTWTLLRSEAMTLAATIEVGLGVASSSASTQATATFSNVSDSGGPPPPPPPNQPPTVSLTAPADGATFTEPASVTVSATAGDADGTVAQVDFYSGATPIGSDTSSPYSIVWNNVSAGTYSITAIARDDVGAATTSAAHTVTVTAPPGTTLPSGWTIGDVGNPAAPGTGSFSNGIFTVSGAGTGVWGPSDQLAFVHRQMTGDGAIVARLETLSAASPDTEAGVMVRESLAANARVVFMRLTQSGWLARVRRLNTGQTASASSIGGFSAPVWLKLERSAGNVLASYSADGVTWTLLRSESMTLAATVDVGLGVASGSASTQATATFSNVTVGGGPPPPPPNQPPTVSLTAPTNGATFTAPASITVSATAADADGSVAQVDFYSGATPIGSDTSSPYSIVWNNVPAGTYSITAMARDNVGATTTSAARTVTVIPPAGGGSIFPLHVEAGKRHLVDAQGNAFLMHGDTPWSLIVQLNQADVDFYLENRRLKGFNTILVNLLEHYFADSPPNNSYGEPPFLTPGDYSTPNEAYFAHAEYVITKAAEKGILVLLTPSYMGFGGGSQGWYQEMAANGATKLRAYGQYLANRFIAHDNIMWVHGGDYHPPDRTLLRAIVDGIRDIDSRWLHTFHGIRNYAAAQWLGPGETWLQVNTTYTDEHRVVDFAFQEYARSTMPFLLIEARYELEGATPTIVRQQAYQTVLSGGAGHLMGHNPVWKLNTWWKTGLDSAGATTLTHLRPLIEARQWWLLQPDTNAQVLTAGIGSGTGRAVAAVASDGSYGLLYTPAVRTLTVDTRQFAGPRIAARWYDPTAGTYAAVGGSPFVAGPIYTFTPAGNNAGGAGDWVLVLESVP